MSDQRERPVVLRPRDGRPRAGRRQERLAGRDGLATSPTSACRCPTGSPRRPTPTTGSSATPAWPSGSRSCSTDLDTDDTRRARRGRQGDPRGGRRRRRSPRTSRPTSARRTSGSSRRREDELSFAVRSSRDRRGPAGRVVRRAAGDLPQRQRHRRGAAGDPRGLRLALQRPGDRLPGAPRLRPRRRRALGRGAADGALRHRRVRRDVHDGHRVRVRRRGVHHLGVRPGRGRRAGRGEPRRVLRLQAGAARRAGPAILKRGVGDKATKMVYTEDAGGRPDHRVRRHRRGRARGCSASTDDEVEELARHALTIEEHYGRPMDIEWGKDGARRRALRAAGAARDGAVARPARRSGSDGRDGTKGADGARRGPGDRPEDRRRRGAGADLGRADARVQRGRGARRRHDRPRLGADHEAGRRRSSPTAAAAPATPRSSPASSASRRSSAPAQRDQGPRGRPTRSRSRAPRATPASSTTACSTSPSRRTELDVDARHPDQDHDERRHARAGVRVLPAAATRASGWPGWSSSSTARSASTPRRCSTSRRPDSMTPTCARRSRRPIAAYPGPREFFVQRVAEGVSTLAAAFAPDPVIVRMSDFKSNEYANLVAGELYEPRRGEPDDRLPRRRRGTSRRSSPTASRWSARRCGTCATRWA